MHGTPHTHSHARTHSLHAAHPVQRRIRHDPNQPVTFHPPSNLLRCLTTPLYSQFIHPYPQGVPEVGRPPSRMRTSPAKLYPPCQTALSALTYLPTDHPKTAVHSPTDNASNKYQSQHLTFAPRPPSAPQPASKRTDRLSRLGSSALAKW
jgi:hypothetical protein